MKKLTLLFSLVLFLISMTVFGQKEKFSTKHFGDIEYTSNPRISPDGKQVIYSRHWTNLIDDKRETDLWIMNIDGSMNRFFINGSNGKWSPDGSKVAFTRKGEPNGTQIFIKFMGVEGEPTQVTRLPESPRNITWSPDSKKIALIMHVPSKTSFKAETLPKPEGAKWTKAPTIIETPVYRRDRVGMLDPGYNQVFVVDASGGTARQVTEGDWNSNGPLVWTNDAKNLIIRSLRIPDADYEFRQSSLYAVNIETKEIKEISDRKGTEGQTRLSPDGKKIAFVGNLWTENFYHANQLFVMNVDGSNLKSISSSLDRTPSNPKWSGDNSKVYFNVREKGTSNIYSADLNGTIKKVTTGNHLLTMNDVSTDGIAVGVMSNPKHPSEIVKVDLSSGSIKKLTDVNSDLLDYVEIGDVEEVNYKSKDGTPVQGWLVKPHDFDPNKKYPLILKIHGGPHSMYHVGFNASNYFHASEGYLVLYTNPRGSTGYGYEFANAIQNKYPGDDYDDLMSGVDEIISRGYVDESKLCVYGGSGGGVLTSWIIGQTDRFAAASVNYPVINWMSFVGTTDGITWYNNFKKKPWEDPAEHLKRSPLMYVGNVTTPTMLMCGVNDLRTPISQTEEYYQALQVNKVPSVMIRFNEEFHGTGSKPSNYLRTAAYLNSWFGKYTNNESKVKP